MNYNEYELQIWIQKTPYRPSKNSKTISISAYYNMQACHSMFQWTLHYSEAVSINAYYNMQRFAPTHFVRCCPFCLANRRWLFGQKGELVEACFNERILTATPYQSMRSLYNKSHYISIYCEENFIKKVRIWFEKNYRMC